MHDPNKPPHGDVSKCPFVSAFDAALQAFKSKDAQPANPSAVPAPSLTDAPKPDDRPATDGAEPPRAPQAR
ncbi:MAG: hypothetical protein LW636_07310 [Planctomycetaceae bacterium]|nr:hypothetical protein [Planctomycetaceae bacterium]